MSTVTEKNYKYKKSGKICTNQNYAVKTYQMVISGRRHYGRFKNFFPQSETLPNFYSSIEKQTNTISSGCPKTIWKIYQLSPKI